MKYLIKVRDNGTIRDATIDVQEDKYSFTCQDICITETDEFPFRALKKIRKKLEKSNIFLLINGSRKDVYSSSMLVYSDKGYIHKMGQQAFKKDMVDIFASTENEDMIGTVEEQEKYLFEWLESLKAK